MTTEPNMTLLPRHHRTIMFWFLFVFFFAVLPVVILYTSGYRLVQTDDGERQLTTTGGVYVAVIHDGVELYVDGDSPEDRRPFSSAFYVQGFDPGQYEIRTQGDGVETWVKQVPIYPQIVSQVLAFNLPRTPVVRLITPWSDQVGTAVIDELVATSSTPLAFATTTNAVRRAPTARATSTLLQNPEYALLETLFASTTAERFLLEEIEMMQAKQAGFAFSSELPTTEIPTTTATTTKFAGELILEKQGEDIYARWSGDVDDVPHYFCVQYESPASTSLQYGTHVYEALVEVYASTTGVVNETLSGQKLCREQIRIDRKWQSVQYFDFLPSSNDLVLLQLQDGVYVVEIDDRAWQNVQLLYPGDYLEVVIDAGRILIKDDEYFVEVFTELQS